MPTIACDIGATRIKFGLVKAGRVLAHTTILSHSEQGLAKRLPELAKAFRKLCAKNKLAISECAGISLSVPTLVDVASGRLLAEYGRFRDMPTLDLRAWAQEEFGLPLALENDARMAAIGDEDFPEEALIERIVLDGGLIGGDLDEQLARLHPVPFFLMPFGNRPLFHRGGKLGHRHSKRHTDPYLKGQL